MTIDFKPQMLDEAKPRITVFGVGGAGGNAVNNMISGKLDGVDFVVANTDSQSLIQSLAEHRVQLGVNITNGLGAGARPDIGRVAAEEALDSIQRYLDGNNMVFIAAGMGGGTGTGAAPIIARAAREQGILTVGVVTKPFQFEGLQRMKLAEAGVQELQSYVDTLIVIPNQNLFRIANEHTGFAEAFKLADDVLHAGVRGVTDLMINPGLINLDFADIRTVMGEMGKAMMGTGEAAGESRAVESAEAAINNPLLDNASIDGAQGVLINITGGADMTLHEVDEAAMRICREVDENANIIFGTSINPELEGSMRVAVIATGIDADSIREPVPETPNNVHVLGLSSDTNTGAGTSAEMQVSTPEMQSSNAEVQVPLGITGDMVDDEESGLLSTEVSDPYLDIDTDTNVSDSPETVSSSEISRPINQVFVQTEVREEVVLKKSVSASVAGGIAAKAKVAPDINKESVSINTSEVELNNTKDAFLPPPPVDPGRPLSTSTDRSVDMMSEADLMNASTDSKKKAPSLFERMTGTGRAREDMDMMIPEAKPTEIAEKHDKEEIVTDPVKSEPRLDIGSSIHEESQINDLAVDEDDPLEIPAFLRRQAN
tara:strand:- start:8472 stop:10274 length:1803 start_codon:yes stop_codon:yes gene_type:complete